MFKRVELMLYVNDVDKVSQFWQEALNAKLLGEMELPDTTHTVKLSVLDQIHINLFSVKFIKKYSPNVSLGFPSLLLLTDDIDAVHKQVEKYSDTVSEISDQGGQQTFNFADPENNYIAVGSIQEQQTVDPQNI